MGQPDTTVCSTSIAVPCSATESPPGATSDQRRRRTGQTRCGSGRLPFSASGPVISS